MTTAMAAWSARTRPDSLDDVAAKIGAEERQYQRLLGSVIRQLRELQVPRMSAATLAERVGRSEAAVSRWETGKATPSAWDLRRLATAFKLEDDQLDMLIRPPDGPVSPVAVRLAEAIRAGGHAGLAGGARTTEGRGAA